MSLRGLVPDPPRKRQSIRAVPTHARGCRLRDRLASGTGVSLSRRGLSLSRVPHVCPRGAFRARLLLQPARQSRHARARSDRRHVFATRRSGVRVPLAPPSSNRVLTSCHTENRWRICKVSLGLDLCGHRINSARQPEAGRLLELPDLVLGQGDLDGGRGVGEVVRLGGSDDRADTTGLVRRPSRRQLQ